MKNTIMLSMLVAVLVIASIAMVSATHVAVSINCISNPTLVGASVTCTASELDNGDISGGNGNIKWYDETDTLIFTSPACTSIGTCVSTYSPNSVGSWDVKFIKGASERASISLTVNPTPVVPEFGTTVGILTALSAVGTFFLVRRK